MAQLQIRDVPSDLHRKLRARAANMGLSLSEYALDELARSVERSEQADLLEVRTDRTGRRTRGRRPVDQLIVVDQYP